MAQNPNPNRLVRVTLVFPFARHLDEDGNELVGWAHPDVRVDWKRRVAGGRNVVAGEVTNRHMVIVVTAPATDVWDVLKPSPEGIGAAATLLHEWVADGDNRPDGPVVEACVAHVRDLFEVVKTYRVERAAA